MKEQDKNLDETLMGFAYFDVILQYCVLVLVFFMLVILMPHKKTNDDAVMAGNICAELYWDNDRDIDLDLWGLSPLDKEPIYFHNMHGPGMDLMRDVIGFSNNPEHLNMEIMCANKMYEGEYTFNVKYFSNKEGRALPGFHMDVDATVLVRAHKANGSTSIIRRTVKFTQDKEEHTLFNFRVDNHGNILKNSINWQEKHL